MHKTVTTLYFKYSLMLSAFDRKTLGPSDYQEAFNKVKRCDTQVTSKYHDEWKEKLQKEMQIFTGKVEFDKNEGETASTVS